MSSTIAATGRITGKPSHIRKSPQPLHLSAGELARGNLDLLNCIFE
jgi:hypothetical protein